LAGGAAPLSFFKGAVARGMGGKKKPTLSQVVKRLEREQQAQKARKEIAKKEEAKQKRSLLLIDEKLLEAVAKEVQSARAVTTYEVASKFGTKMTTAAKILRALSERGELVLVSRGHRTEIYAPARVARGAGPPASPASSS